MSIKVINPPALNVSNFADKTTKWSHCDLEMGFQRVSAAYLELGDGAYTGGTFQDPWYTARDDDSLQFSRVELLRRFSLDDG